MLRVVELDIDFELTGDTGVWEIAWVEMPAIERELVFFSREFEFVYPASGEEKEGFIGRCMGSDKMVGEFPDSDQRSAVCYSYWDRKDEFSVVDKVSFDWDTVLSKSQGMRLMQMEQYRGTQLFIISSKPIVTRDMLNFAGKYNIPPSRVFATGSDSGKVRKIKELGIKRHYDENLFVRNDLRGIAVDFDYDVSALPDYDNYPDSGDTNGMLVKETFETYSDYPEGAKNNACRAIKWKEENGSDCGTQVGWTRARQLCNGEKLSRETIARMSSFERHRQNSEVPYSEGCGGIMWDAWGGDSGIRWAQNKLEEIDQQESMALEDACWEGYEPIGMKEKDGRQVPNCVPISMTEEFTVEDWELIHLMDSLRKEENFEAVSNQLLRGFTKDEVLKQNHKNKTTYYEYKRVLSGSPDRDFCTSIEGRFFRIAQIYALQDYNTDFGHNQEPYSKWLYKGGPNCIHAWSQWEALQKDFREIGLVGGKPGTPPKSMPNSGYYNEETKRKSEVAYIISQQNMSSQREQIFRSVEDKKMIYTPLMIPNILIPRIDDVSGERYYVKFKPEVIEKIQQKFMIEQRLRETNYEHSNKKFSDAVMVESWIVAGDSDKAYSLGFSKEQVPQGSWMGGYKILDTDEGNELWNKYIKTGKVKGMSVEGNFLLEFSRIKTDDYLLEQIINILNKLQ